MRCTGPICHITQDGGGSSAFSAHFEGAKHHQGGQACRKTLVHLTWIMGLGMGLSGCALFIEIACPDLQDPDVEEMVYREYIEARDYHGMARSDRRKQELRIT